MGTKGKDSKITLTQESAHFVPSDLSNDFFKQINLAMKIKWEELKKGVSSNQINKITKGEMMQAFGVTKISCSEMVRLWVRMKGLRNWRIRQPDYPKGMHWKTTTMVQKKRKKISTSYKQEIQKGLHLK